MQIVLHNSQIPMVRGEFLAGELACIGAHLAFLQSADCASCRNYYVYIVFIKGMLELVSKLFRERFDYETVVVSLDEIAPQFQLIHAISMFIRDYDGPNNLLIIYYTGHAMNSSETKRPSFMRMYIYMPTYQVRLLNTMHSRKNLRSSRQDAQHSQQSVKWDVIEPLLLDNTQADILAIMDTNFIANETNAEGYTGRAFQLIAASPPDHTLAEPGPNSFTCAMIQVLNEWLDGDGGRLSSWKLGERINDRPSRISSPCFL